MRLLLDEHLPATIAEALRDRGHDVVAVQERPHWRGLSDADLLAVARAERRAVVTENVAHLRACADTIYARGDTHHGIVYLTNKGWPRHQADAFVGAVIIALDTFLAHHPEAEQTVLEVFLSSTAPPTAPGPGSR